MRNQVINVHPNKTDTHPKIEIDGKHDECQVRIITYRSKDLTMPRPRRTQGSLGTAYQFKRVCEKLGYQRVPGLKNRETYFL